MIHVGQSQRGRGQQHHCTFSQKLNVSDDQAPAMPCPIHMHMRIKQHADCTSVSCNLARVSRHIFSPAR
jgi:hypothetical protein